MTIVTVVHLRRLIHLFIFSYSKTGGNWFNKQTKNALSRNFSLRFLLEEAFSAILILNRSDRFILKKTCSRHVET